MKYLLAFLSAILLLACTNDTQTQPSQEAFSINLSSAFAPGAALNVPVNARLILESTADLDTNTINNNTVYIEDSTQHKHPTKVHLVNRNIIITPTIYFQPSTQYNIIISSEVTNSSGIALSQPIVINFTSGTAVDNKGPKLVATLPKDINTSDSHPYTLIYFQFNEAIAPFIPDASTIQVHPPSGPDIQGTLQLSGRLLSFKPNTDLSIGVYDVDLNTSLLKDLSGNSYNGNSIVSTTFSTHNISDAEPISTVTETITPYETHNIVNHIEDEGDILYIGTNDGLHIIKYNTSSRSFSTLSELSLGEGVAIYDIALDINDTAKIYHLLIASSDGFTVIDIENSHKPKILSHFKVIDTQNQQASTPVYGLDRVDNTVYLAATLVGVVALDITDVLHPVALFSVDNNGTTFDVINIGSTLYMSNYDANTTKMGLDGSNLTREPTQGVGLTHNMSYRYDGSSATYEPIVAGGTSGLVLRDSYTFPAVYKSRNAASYLSRIIIGNRTSDTQFEAYGIVKRLGIITFNTSLYESSYQRLPYEATTLGYIDNHYNPSDPTVKGLLIIADNEGKIHAFEK